MLFGPPTRPIDDLLPRLQAVLGVIDTNMATSYLSDAFVQFCRESQLVRRTQCIKIDACINSYLLNKILKDERLSEIISVRQYSKHCNIPRPFETEYYIDNNTIHFADTPCNVGDTVEVTYTVIPKRDSDFIYDFIYEDWLEAIIHLALSNLYILSDMEWYDVQVANYHRAKYEEILRASRLHNVTKHKAMNIRIRPKWRY